MDFQYRKLLLIYITIFLSFFQPILSESSVKVAVVHFQPHCGAINDNINRLAALANEAGANGAKIVVFPELATSGYSYFSRHDIQDIVQEIPGKNTNVFAKIAEQYGMYIILGIPEYCTLTHQYYNSAVLIGPDGNLAGTYRKHSHLIESSWSSLDRGQLPVYDTIYGKLAILICADINYSELSIQATLKKANFLILPTNGGINENLLQARAIEGNCHVILANRYGNELNEYLDITPLENFNEETFRIIPPFHYDFQDGKSIIIDSNGQINLVIDSPSDTIGYCELSLNQSKKKIIRRPELYSLIGQNTLDTYALKCMKLPIPSCSTILTASLKSKSADDLLKEICEVILSAKNVHFNLENLKLIVFPADVITLESWEINEFVNFLKQLAEKTVIDIVIGIRTRENNYAVSYLITKEKKDYCYKRIHKFENEEIQTGDHFFVIDREYGRLALLQCKDLLAPESTKVLAKMGVDLVAVSGNMDNDIIKIFSKARSLEYLHIAMSNLNGSNGIYLGGFLTYPSFKENDSITVMELNTKDVREKKELKIGYDTQLILKDYNE